MYEFYTNRHSKTLDLLAEQNETEAIEIEFKVTQIHAEFCLRRPLISHKRAIPTRPTLRLWLSIFE